MMNQKKVFLCAMHKDNLIKEDKPTIQDDMEKKGKLQIIYSCIKIKLTQPNLCQS